MADPKTGDVEPEVIEEPALPTSDTVWLRHSNGVAHNVNVGSEAHKRLVADGAVPIEGPTEDESKVTDHAMVEKAKADDKPRR